MKKEVEKIEETSKYPHKALDQIEKDRIAFLGKYKTQNNLKLVIAVLCIAAVFAAFLFVPGAIGESNPKLANALTIIICVVFLGGGLTYAILSRKFLEKKMHAYFNAYFSNVNEFVFDQKVYSDVALQEPGKITLEEFSECRLYKVLISCNSRALTFFKYHGVDMTIVESSGNIKREDKRIAPVFVGKEIIGKAKYEGNDQIVVYLKGNERALPPTNLGELEKVEENAQYLVATNCKTYKKVLTKEIVEKIKAIKTNDLLVDVAISIHSGKVFVMMGYDDPLMVLPLQSVFNSKPVETFKKDLVKVCELVEALGK